jgi:very-short-patch-repair endonuclease
MRQYPIEVGRARRTGRLAYSHARLAIEADGYRYHSGRVPWERDRARLNDLTLLGWRVIHVTWTEFTRRPARTIDAIARALATGP